MAKKLLIKTPQTIDGVNLRYGADNQVAYKVSIVEPAARKNILNLNSRLPQHLHHIIEEVEVEDQPVGLSNEDLRKKLAQLEAEEENKSLRARIAELEAKANGVPAGAAQDDENEVRQKAAEVIAKIKEASTVEEVNELSTGDTRKGVIDAAGKRIAELEAK